MGQGVNWESLNRINATAIEREKEKRELNLALQKILLEASLKNQQLKKGADLSKIGKPQGWKGAIGKILGIDTSDGQLPDLSQFEATPDYTQMRSLLGMQNLTKQMEQKRRLGVMAEQEPTSEEEIAQFTPQLQRPILGLGRVEGGEVALPKRATYAEGQILSPEGQRIGEYLPGYEPKEVGKFPVGQGEIVSAMRERFAPGISKEELQRKALGIGRFMGKATQGQVVNLATKLAQAENPMAGEKEIKAKMPIAQTIFSGQAMGISEGEYTDEQENLIQDNMDAYPDKTREEIIEALQEQGHL